MVWILIVFIINNLIWATLLVFLMCILNNKPINSIIKKFNKRKTDEGEEEYENATDDQIINEFEKLQDIINPKNNNLYDASGSLFNGVSKEEPIE